MTDYITGDRENSFSKTNSNCYYMSGLIQFFNILAAIFFMVLQQCLVIGIGILVLDSSGLEYAIIVWMLSIPMIYLNIATWKYMMKYGLISFLTANSDTSEIDVKPEERPYKK